MSHTPTTALLLVLDQVDYMRGRCSATEMVGAVLSREVLKTAREAVVERRGTLRDELDPDVVDWVYGVLNDNPGDFVRAFADAASRADFENYPLLRPSVVAIAARYPHYLEVGRKYRQLVERGRK